MMTNLPSLMPRSTSRSTTCFMELKVGVMSADIATTLAPVSAALSTIARGSTSAPRSCTSKPLALNRVATMFFPISCTSPLGVAMTRASLPFSPAASSSSGSSLPATSLKASAVKTSSARKYSPATVPAGLEELNAQSGVNGGFESGTGGWSAATDGGVSGVFELNQQPALSHTGSNSIRIKDPKASSAPYTGCWQSYPVSVQEGKSYTLSAFARTRAFNSVARSYLDGKYSPATDSRAGVGLMYLKADGTAAGLDRSDGIKDTTDWTPLEVTATAPAGAVQAKVILYTSCPNAQGISGSVWFDDVSFITESPLSVFSISPSSGVNNGTVNATVGGVGFNEGATVRLERGSTVVNGGDVLVTSGEKATCKLNINGRPLGK